MKHINLTIYSALLFTASGAFAATPTYNQGDLIVGFRASGGTGADRNVLVNLGSAAGFRDHTVASGNLSLGDINTDMVAQFGPNWASRTDIFWGIACSPSNSADFNGDTAKTVYASKAEVTPGTPVTGWAISVTNRGIASTAMMGMEGYAGSGGFSLSNASSGNARLAVQDSTTVNWWSSFQPGGANSTGSTAFKVFNGGIEGTLAKPLDLFRITSTTAGTYVGSFSINATGVISYTGPSAGSGYAAWATTMKLTAANNGANQDPDSDGISNLMEYVLGGDPLAASTSILPVQTSDATHIYLSFSRSVASKSDTTQFVQWSTDLSTWTSIPVGSASAGAVNVVTNGSNPETVTVTIPRSNAGAGGRLFTRLQVNQ